MEFEKHITITPHSNISGVASDSSNAFKLDRCPRPYKQQVTSKYLGTRLHSFSELPNENNIFKEMASSNHYSKSIKYEELDFVLDNETKFLPPRPTLIYIQILQTKCNSRGTQEGFSLSLQHIFLSLYADSLPTQEGKP
jgi:hypothetical protein